MIGTLILRLLAALDSDSLSLGLALPPLPAAELAADGASAEPPPPVARPSFFEQGRFTANGLASAEFADEGDAQYLARGGGGYFLLDGLALNGEILAGAADPRGEEEAWVIGLDLVLRWHLLRGGDEPEAAAWSAFLDIGGGIQQASDEFPPGSHFNFRTRLGFGGTVEIAEDVSLIGGASFVHISNSNLGDVNPGMSGTLVYLGVLVHF